MKLRNAALAGTCAVAISLSACGSDDQADAGPDPADKRAVAFECISKEKGVESQLLGDKKSIRVQPPDGPRIEFFTSTGEAEGKQFLGGAQDAEQIGAALLYVDDASDKLLQDLEDCLNRQ